MTAAGTTTPASTLGRFALWPVLMLGPILGLFGLTNAGVDLAIAAPALVVFHIVTIAILERVWPRVEGVNLFGDNQAPRDVAHGVLTSALGNPLGAVIATAILASARLPDGLDRWPQSLPLAAQVLIGWLLYGFGDYWKHRAYHSVDTLWWLHSIHHDTPQMHVLKGGRLHLLEGTARAGLVSLPLLLLGVPGDVLVWVVTADSFIGNLNHSNLDQRFPRLFQVLVPTIDLHHIHHAVDRSLHDTNLGIPIYDLAFGTYTAPDVAPRPRVGTTTPVPGNFSGQLLFPLRQWSAAARAARADLN